MQSLDELLPEYKPRYGFTLWLGTTGIAFLLITTGKLHPDLGAGLSLASFIAALSWAQGGLQLRPGDWQTPPTNEPETRDNNTDTTQTNDS